MNPPGWEHAKIISQWNDWLTTRLLIPSFNHLTSPDSLNFWHTLHEPFNVLIIVHARNSKKCWLCCYHWYGHRNLTLNWQEKLKKKHIWMEDVEGFTSYHHFLQFSPEISTCCSVFHFALSSWLNGYWVMFRCLWFSCSVTYIAELHEFILQGSVSFCMPFLSQWNLSAGDEAQFVKAACPSDIFS